MTVIQMSDRELSRLRVMVDLAEQRGGGKLRQHPYESVITPENFVRIRRPPQPLPMRRQPPWDCPTGSVPRGGNGGDGHVRRFRFT